MKIVVIGGSGLIGTQLVDRLSKLGHEVIAASPATGVNTLTGEGLLEALNRTDVVVDVANSPSFEDKAVMNFFEVSGRNLFQVEKKCKIKHHVALSVVGTDRLQESGYLRAKQTQENLIKDSGILYSIVHSTQFFEFLGGIAATATEGGVVRLSSAKIQPIASSDVAAMMADVIVGSPLNDIIEIAGPDQFSLAEIVQLYLQKNNDPRKVTVDNHARYYGAELTDQMLLPGGNARIGKINFDTWYVNQPKKP
ncbi:SDR family oxidoreductase [Mucilaginibacter sabulilitoris]|uniref:SDR family oxidoreductase n=1 Tax=Mucilaginibacter sabulilitoris TaxID=1173583 RepID=A0ABZ0TET2_9SPHI|nr:SDR family oxidoreductase [Mucilaginibacter sabulilitoris]WPU90922.1 SDR family oxidoreductase [Mucilaginibacter sabulilitoris]